MPVGFFVVFVLIVFFFFAGGGIGSFCFIFCCFVVCLSLFLVFSSFWEDVTPSQLTIHFRKVLQSVSPIA